MTSNRKRSLRFSASGAELPPQGGCIIRPAIEADARQITDGFNATFGLHRPPEYWTAKFSAPHGPASFVAVDSVGKVHGQFSGYPATLRNRGKSEAVLFAADVFARRSVAAIRQGIFLKVFREFFTHYATADHFVGIMGFPNAVALGLYQTTGYISHNSELSEFAFDVGYASRGRAGALSRYLMRIFRSSSPELKTFAEMDPTFVSAVEMISRTRANWLDVTEFDRSAAWLDWRYRIVGQHYGVYAYHLVLVGGTPVGWVVTRRIESTLCFVDWRFVFRGSGTAEQLAGVFSEIWRQSGAGRAVALMSSCVRAEFGETLSWQQIGSVPFAKVDFGPWRLDVSTLSLNYGDTDLR